MIASDDSDPYPEPEVTQTSMRSHLCGALRPVHVGCQVRLGGWVHRRRDLGGMVFFDLRDREGIVQVAFGPDWAGTDVIRRAGTVGAESVVIVDGTVVARPDEAVNPEMATGAVEVHASSLRLVGPAETPAIPVWRSKGEPPPSEERRLEYRNLDLRRPEMQSNLALRHRLLQRARAALSGLGFFEVETPILTKPTPEGARDYLVPSRVQRGHFYALPQSPQIYKQVLMACGFDRYFQMARCFRDEDLRADRQPEFTQIDLEASFVSAADIRGVVETVLTALWDEGGHAGAIPFSKMTYAEAIERYGTDKPDLRFELAIEDLKPLLQGRGFRAFEDALANGGRVCGIRVPGGASLSRKATDGLAETAKAAGLGGLALLKRAGERLSGPLAKLEGMTAEVAGMADGDLLLAAGGPAAVVAEALGAVRTALIARTDPEPRVPHAFVWVDGFPLFEPATDGEGWTFAHHPFTAPVDDHVDRVLAGEASGVRAQHYDVVYNGVELGSGSIRISDADLQLRALETVGIGREEAVHRFGFLLRALRGGTPPHGGMALGFDRIVMLLARADNLREVIAFPKTTAARALFEDAPTVVPARELEQLGISTRP